MAKENEKAASGDNVVERALEGVIFWSRWFQAPMYLGLVMGAVIYAYKFLIELVHLCIHVNTLSEEAVMLGVLTLVDITMVANLITMVVIGGYSSFVSKLPVMNHEDRPDWLEKVDASSLKVKLVASLIGISAIHLLKSFINLDDKPLEQVKWQVYIHMTFLLSGIALAICERILHPHVPSNGGHGHGHSHRAHSDSSNASPRISGSHAAIDPNDDGMKTADGHHGHGKDRKHG